MGEIVYPSNGRYAEERVVEVFNLTRRQQPRADFVLNIPTGCHEHFLLAVRGALGELGSGVPAVTLTQLIADADKKGGRIRMSRLKDHVYSTLMWSFGHADQYFVQVYDREVFGGERTYRACRIGKLDGNGKFIVSINIHASRLPQLRDALAAFAAKLLL